jgi:hypothetical protein
MVLKLGHIENKSEIPSKFLDVVLQKDGENDFCGLYTKKYYTESRRRGIFYIQ